ncbi:MAG: 2-amino-4-hydroxy-6-hydroxymethyldihydropteridine diphosphokinase [Pyrinomonadaceae bacterium]
MEHVAYVSCGSNLGDRAGNLLLGIRGMIEASLRVNRISRVFETEPVDNTLQPAFLNLVVELKDTRLPSPESLLARLMRVEYALGRTRDILKGPRTIDLDLLVYDKHESETEYLTLPHPRLHLRRFVLVPLNELAPGLVVAGLQKSVGELLAQTPDTSEVTLWSPGPH